MLTVDRKGDAPMNYVIMTVLCTLLLVASHLPGVAAGAESGKKQVPAKVTVTFPLGAATPSEVCGECHKAIYREHSHGFGSDNPAMKIRSTASNKRGAGPSFAATPKGTSHALAGVDSFPLHARDVEEEGKSCNTCHFPQPFILPDLDIPDVASVDSLNRRLTKVSYVFDGLFARRVLVIDEVFDQCTHPLCFWYRERLQGLKFS